MKILYIDPVSSKGHLNFNKIYINALQEKCKVNFIFKEGYIKELGFSTDNLKFSIPRMLYTCSKSKIITRLYLLLQLLYIRLRISFKQYDYVFISYYEEISFYLSGMKAPNLVLINHRNTAGFNSAIKAFFLKKVSKRISFHIVFKEYMKEYFEQNGIKNVKVISHGLPTPYIKPVKNNILESRIPTLGDFRYIIFSPSFSSSDQYFIDKLQNDKSFCDYLEFNHILLIIKGIYKKGKSKNIFILDNYIDQNLYEALFIKSDLILICYPSTFDYCVSAVLFECISNNKPCLMSDIRALRSMESFFNYDSYYSNIEQLENLISKTMKGLPDTLYLSKELLKPNFNFI